MFIFIRRIRIRAAQYAVQWCPHSSGATFVHHCNLTGGSKKYGERLAFKTFTEVSHFWLPSSSRCACSQSELPAANFIIHHTQKRNQRGNLPLSNHSDADIRSILVIFGSPKPRLMHLQLLEILLHVSCFQDDASNSDMSPRSAFSLRTLNHG